MSPLLSIAAVLIPDFVRILAGGKSAETATKIASAFKEVLDTNDEAQAKQKLDADPVAKAELQKRLAEIALETAKAEHIAEQNRKAAELDLAKAQHESDRQKRESEFVLIKEKFAEIQRGRDAEFKNKEMDFKDTQTAREINSQIIQSGSKYSWINPALSLVIVIGFFGFALILLVPGLAIDDTKEIFLIALGALSAAFSTVVGFHFGSSAGSKQKDLTLQAEAAASAQQAINAAPKKNPAAAESDVKPDAPLPPDAADVPLKPADRPPVPTVPASPSLFAEELPRLMRPHRHFEDAASWALSGRGIAVDGGKAAGTQGKPSTVTSIWEKFGESCAAAAREFGVPVELIVATIATESRGDPTARRPEPKHNDESVGLMQTLVGSAREALGRPSLRGNDLLDPALSIRAGTAFIARQRASTHFDPPLVAAAYNAGSLHRNDGPANRWKLRCFPIGTGEHIDRFIAWFGDAMIVSAQDDWGSGGAPSFAGALATRAPNDMSRPGFPPRPAFAPVIDLADRRRLFGTFDFDSAPVPGNPENIIIKGTWEKNNIIDVKLEGIVLPGKNRELVIRLHKDAAHQLQGLWQEWRQLGLLDKVLTYDGGYVPRFIRGSTSVLSNHAFGSAFDINARWNPLKEEPALVGEEGCVRELVATANKWGFFWGGHFKSRLDGMHFEVSRIVT